MTKPTYDVLKAAVDTLVETLRVAEAKEGAARDAHAAAKQHAGHLRQQLHFARVRLSKVTSVEDQASALGKRSMDPSLTQAERDAAKEAYFQLLDRENERQDHD